MAYARGKQPVVVSSDRYKFFSSAQRTPNGSGTVTASAYHHQGGPSTHLGPSTQDVNNQTSTHPLLTHKRLTKHDHYYARGFTTYGDHQAIGHTASMTQAAAHTAKVTAAGRSLGFDLSEPVHGEAMRRYDGMTPAQRFLAEEDRAKCVRAAAGQDANGSWHD